MNLEKKEEPLNVINEPKNEILENKKGKEPKKDDVLVENEIDEYHFLWNKLKKEKEEYDLLNQKNIENKKKILEDEDKFNNYEEENGNRIIEKGEDDYEIEEEEKLFKEKEKVIEKMKVKLKEKEDKFNENSGRFVPRKYILKKENSEIEKLRDEIEDCEKDLKKKKEEAYANREKKKKEEEEQKRLKNRKKIEESFSKFKKENEKILEDYKIFDDINYINAANNRVLCFLKDKDFLNFNKKTEVPTEIKIIDDLYKKILSEFNLLGKATKRMFVKRTASDFLKDYKEEKDTDRQKRICIFLVMRLFGLKDACKNIINEELEKIKKDSHEIFLEREKIFAKMKNKNNVEKINIAEILDDAELNENKVKAFLKELAKKISKYEDSLDVKKTDSDGRLHLETERKVIDELMDSLKYDAKDSHYIYNEKEKDRYMADLCKYYILKVADRVVNEIKDELEKNIEDFSKEYERCYQIHPIRDSFDWKNSPALLKKTLDKLKSSDKMSDEDKKYLDYIYELGENFAQATPCLYSSFSRLSREKMINEVKRIIEFIEGKMGEFYLRCKKTNMGIKEIYSKFSRLSNTGDVKKIITLVSDNLAFIKKLEDECFLNYFSQAFENIKYIRKTLDKDIENKNVSYEEINNLVKLNMLEQKLKKIKAGFYDYVSGYNLVDSILKELHYYAAGEEDKKYDRALFKLEDIIKFQETLLYSNFDGLKNQNANTFNQLSFDEELEKSMQLMKDFEKKIDDYNANKFNKNIEERNQYVLSAFNNYSLRNNLVRLSIIKELFDIMDDVDKKRICESNDG